MADLGRYVGALSVRTQQLGNTPQSVALGSVGSDTTAASTKPLAKMVHQLATQAAYIPLFDPQSLPLEPTRVYLDPFAEKPSAPPAELTRIRAVWPFDFFPSELIIEDGRFILHDHRMFGVHTATMLLANVASCNINKSIYFAELTIDSKFGDEITLRWLKIEDATRAKEIIDELMWREKSSSSKSDDVLFATKLLHLLDQTHHHTPDLVQN